MSHDKAIQHGKEHRKPYRDSRRFDASCRHGGSCGYCRGNRTHANTVSEDVAQSKIEDEKLPPRSLPLTANQYGGSAGSNPRRRMIRWLPVTTRLDVILA